MKILLSGSMVGLMLFMGACTAGGGGSKADQKFERGEYEFAIQEYQTELKKGKNVAHINYQIAESYRLSNRIQEAEQYYKAAIDNNIENKDVAFYYGLALKANGKYSEAESQLNNFASAGANQDLVARAKQEAQNLTQLSSITSRKQYNVQLLTGLNSAGADYSPVKFGDELVFSTTRAGKTYAGNGEGFTDLYAIKFDAEKMQVSGAERSLSTVINLPDFHESSATFSRDGKTMVFARSNEGTKEGRKDVDLFISRFQNNAWSEAQPVSLNSKDNWDSTPSYAPDGQTLYFASSRPGGLGGTDIYKATVDASGRFSEPQNLGAPVNTAGNESFPLMGEDGTLYFSSDGHPGLGGLDLFKLQKGKAVNLGTEINSIADDFGILPINRNSGLFSSNRGGGSGSDDIYRYDVFRIDVTFNAEINVTDAATNQKLSNAKVSLLDAKGNKLQEQLTDEKGLVKFKLDSASTYTVLGEKDGYFSKRETLSTVGKTPKVSDLAPGTTEVTIPLNVPLALSKLVVNKPIVIKNIFYDFNKADIRPDAAIILDSVAQVIKDTPGIRMIELSSHTDSRGSDIYNLDLSQRRAKSVVKYLISKGVDKNIIADKGYGETKPVVKNAKTEAQHQLNRRTQFVITKMDGQKVASPSLDNAGNNIKSKPAAKRKK